MALQMNYYNRQFDVTLYDAYWRINPENGLFGGKNRMNYVIEVFKNAEMSKVENPQPLDRMVFSFIPDLTEGAGNFISQAYIDAKTRPEFSGSVDV